jgi:hypothetical protein
MLGLAGLALLLAWATWAWVEQPFRRRPVPLLPRRGVLFGASGLAVAAAVGFGLAADNSRFVEARLSAAERAMLDWLDYADSPAFAAANRAPTCFLLPATEAAAFDPVACLTPDPARHNLLLVGDSHAAHYRHGLESALPGVNILQATTAGCRPLDPPRGEPVCEDLMRLVWDDWLPRNAATLDAIVLAGRWRASDLGAIGPTLARLVRYGVPVLVLGPVAEFSPDAPLILSRLPPGADPDAALGGFLNRPRAALATRVAAEVRAAGLPYVDVQGAQCGADARCLALAPSGAPVVWDYGHFTADGSALIVARLIARDPAMAALAARLR